MAEPRTIAYAADRTKRRVRLGDICVVVSGSTPKTSVKEYWNGTIKWVTPAEIKDDTRWLSDTSKHITDEGFISANLTMMPAGTVLLSSRAPIGKVAITAEPMCCNQGFKNLICSDEVVNEYLFWHLKAKVQQLQSLGRGATFKELSKKAVESYKIWLPPINEQKAIAFYFSAIDTLITKLIGISTLFDTLIKSRFIEMFGDSILNCCNFPRRPWGEVLTIRNGKNQTAVEQADGPYPICGSGGEIGRASSYITSQNSVIIGRKGNINNPILMRVPFWNVDTAFGLEPDEQHITVEYLYEYCQFFDFRKLNKAVTIPSLTKADLLKIKMPIPSIDAQRSFSKFVQQVDKLRFDVQQQIEKLETLKKSLMQEYFG